MVVSFNMHLWWSKNIIRATCTSVHGHLRYSNSVPELRAAILALIHHHHFFS